jgi:hypothetical protein
MPANTVYVGRPTKWGNPFHVVDILDAYDGDRAAAHADCVRSFGELIARGSDELGFQPSEIAGLRGKDLSCWCPLDQACHADVLLELANAPETVS